MENKHNSVKQVLRRQPRWETLYFYQKSVVLYQMTFFFTKRFLRKGDRTVDQMVQAARSGKQNIVEGSADGVTSMEMEIKLMNAARGSIQELQKDYEDYLVSRGHKIWKQGHQRYERMLLFCRAHNSLKDYQPYFEIWSDEEMANVALTLCHMVDRMMTTYEKQLEADFVTEGGIRERMTAARLGYRTNQKEEIASLRQELETLKRQNVELEKEIKRLKGDFV